MFWTESGKIRILKTLHFSLGESSVPPFLMLLCSLVGFRASAAPELPLLTSVRQVREMSPEQAAQGDRVHLRGVVTFYDAKDNVGLFLQDATAGIFVKWGEGTNVNAGDEVEIEGTIKRGDYAPLVFAEHVRVIGHQSEPAPVHIRIGQPPSADFNNMLVRLRGRLINRTELADEQILVLEDTNLILNARLDATKADSRVLALQNGSELELTGVCMAQPLENWHSSLKSHAEAFQLLLRSSDDVAVIRNPPWWTLSRLFWMLGIMSAVFLAWLAWVFALDRKVRQQIAMIQQKLQREAVLEERTRLAREFHDTLEQELAAITIQLETAASQFDAAPRAARQMLELACNMTRRSLFEARRSVWDLRSHLLENSNLVTAISEVAKLMAASTHVAISVETSGAPSKLPLPIENNLLRIAQEALTNALKHALATQIFVRLHYAPGKVSLRVMDDGAGFDTNKSRSAIYGGHFGLRDMSERAMKMGGRFDVISAPGQGTEILVEIAGTAGSALAAGAESRRPEEMSTP
jgi:signal transduction histidine kinase